MSDADPSTPSTSGAPGVPAAPVTTAPRTSTPPPAGTTPVGRGPAPALGPPEGPSRTEGPDWTQQVTDLIVDTVDKVRARTTGPILEISKGLVLALVAMVLVVPVVALLLIFVVRLLDWAIPGDVWIVYCGLGIIFVLAGVVLWRLRTPRHERR